VSGGRIAADWIAVDWGTSNLRAWRMDADGSVLDRAGSDAGMGRLKRDGFEPALLDLVGNWLGEGATQVVACGMVGAREGWVEAPYSSVPSPPLGAGLVRAPAADARLSVHVVPGVSQTRPPDVMRGEETQIAGLVAREPGFDGVACLPGTHCKWAHVSAGDIVSFVTFMTGELFELLSTASVLRHSTGGEGWSDEDFAQAMQDAMARPERVAAALFGLRAAALLEGLAASRARARLSGMLIGLELAGARPYWLGRDVVLIGGAALSARYAEALAVCGLEARICDGTEMTLAGLKAARALV
jgi:2-dehydro-3-deoxygalactonokinase